MNHSDQLTRLIEENTYLTKKIDNLEQQVKTLTNRNASLVLENLILACELDSMVLEYLRPRLEELSKLL